MYKLFVFPLQTVTYRYILILYILYILYSDIFLVHLFIGSTAKLPTIVVLLAKPDNKAN